MKIDNLLTRGLLLLVVIAFLVRTTWELLQPALLPLGIVLGLGGVLLAMVRRRDG